MNSFCFSLLLHRSFCYCKILALVVKVHHPKHKPKSQCIPLHSGRLSTVPSPVISIISKLGSYSCRNWKTSQTLCSKWRKKQKHFCNAPVNKKLKMRIGKCAERFQTRTGQSDQCRDWVIKHLVVDDLLMTSSQEWHLYYCSTSMLCEF